MNKSVAQIVSGLDWPSDDIRWTALSHFLTRVESAGISLVSHADRVRLVPRHLQPSLEALPFIPHEGQLLDVGSGGGFPAIPIALARPGLTVTMVEANGRKAAFLLRVSRETNAMNTQVLNARAEALTKEYHQQYDMITARAVDNIPKLIKWTKKLLTENGKWLLWKGRSWRDEGNLDRLKLKLLEEVTLSDGGRLLLLERAELKLP